MGLRTTVEADLCHDRRVDKLASSAAGAEARLIAEERQLNKEKSK